MSTIFCRLARKLELYYNCISKLNAIIWLQRCNKSKNLRYFLQQGTFRIPSTAYLIKKGRRGKSYHLISGLTRNKTVGSIVLKLMDSIWIVILNIFVFVKFFWDPSMSKWITQGMYRSGMWGKFCVKDPQMVDLLFPLGCIWQRVMLELIRNLKIPINGTIHVRQMIFNVTDSSNTTDPWKFGDCELVHVRQKLRFISLFVPSRNM